MQPYIYVLMCAFLISGCSKSPPPMPKKVVSVEVVQKKPFQFSVDLIGVIEPKHVSVLAARASGAVDFYKQSGDILKKGDVIAAIQNDEVKRAAELSKREADLAQIQYERVEKLGHSKTMSQQEVDTKKMAFIRAQVQATEALNKLEDHQFIAPFDEGVVGVFKVREGAHMNVGDALVTYYKPGALVIHFDIPEPFVPFVKTGQDIIIDGKTLPLTGFQHMIDPASHMAPAYVDYTCDGCVVGSNTTLTLVMYKNESDISVPNDALTYSADGSTAFVYVVKEGKANPAPVKVGHRQHDRTQILSGLSVGDQVIARGTTRLFPGVAVEVYQPKESSK